MVLEKIDLVSSNHTEAGVTKSGYFPVLNKPWQLLTKCGKMGNIFRLCKTQKAAAYHLDPQKMSLRR